jgi:hypothetical protein
MHFVICIACLFVYDQAQFFQQLSTWLIGLYNVFPITLLISHGKFCKHSHHQTFILPMFKGIILLLAVTMVITCINYFVAV